MDSVLIVRLYAHQVVTLVEFGALHVIVSSSQS